VNLFDKKTPSERDPFALLHDLHALTQLSGLNASSGLSLIGIT
jgi:hypothetical protein